MKYGYCNGYHLSVVTPPAVEPITLDEALVQCHANQGVEDEWFYETIKAVRLDAEMFVRRAFIEQTLRVTFDKFPSIPILLPRPPLISVESVSLYDIYNVETVIDISNLYVDTFNCPGRISINSGYSLPSVSLRELNSIVIQYKAGYGTTPDDVPNNLKQAMLLHLGFLYESRSGEPEPINEQYECLLKRQRLYL